MSHTIPDEFVFHSALYKNLEYTAQHRYGSISSKTLIQTINMLKTEDQNIIVSDLYSQILNKIS